MSSYDYTRNGRGRSAGRRSPAGRRDSRSRMRSTDEIRHGTDSSRVGDGRSRASGSRTGVSRAERERTARQATRGARKKRRSVGADVLAYPLNVGDINAKRNLTPRGRGTTARRVQEQRAEEGVPIRPAVYTQKGRVGIRDRIHIARRWGTGLGIETWKIVVVGLLIVVLAAVAIFGPLKDYYVAWRNAGILQVEYEVLSAINEDLTDDVERLNTLEGIEDEARRRGYVYPDEEALVVEGVEEKDLAEQEELQRALDEYDKSLPWYIHTLDGILGYSPNK